MRSVLVGVGQAGGKVTAAITEFDERMGYDAVIGSLAVNTAKADLQELPVETLLIGQDRVGGHGVGGDNELGAEVMESDAGQVMTALDGRITAEAEAIWVVAGLGGGTGSGGAPVLARELCRVYDTPVYVLGVLPGRDEGSMYQVNAGRSLKTVAEAADATLLIDNDAFRETGESVSEGFEAINDAIARRIGLLLAAGEAVEGVGESVVDTSEVINTLRTGGLATIGYASARAGEAADVNTITSVTRNAVLTGACLPNATSAETALVVLAGRPENLSRKGIERARSWVEDETGSMQVRGGDFPLDSDRVAALVLLGGIERSDRVQSFLDRAREAATAEEPDDDPTESLLNDEIDELL
ncbi:MAG: tubulin/FtsZ family protein [Halobaculum sp.]